MRRVRRRTFLAASAAVGTFSLAGCAGLLGGEHGLSSTTVKTVDANGSSAGTLTLPTNGVTVVDVFSTSCSPCLTELDRLKTARSRLDASVSFVSVTNQVLGGSFTEADLRKWWRKHGGAWTLAVDSNGTLDRELDVTGLPTLAVVAADGTVAWTHEGVASVDAVVSAVSAARG